MTLLVVSIWLQRQGKPILYTALPMIALSITTAWAMVGNLTHYFADFEALWLLALSGTLVLGLDLWILFEGGRMLVTGKPAEANRTANP